jgi:hypothetical protein
VLAEGRLVSPESAVEAINERGRLWVCTASGSTPQVAHLFDGEKCIHMDAATAIKPVEHPAELPLSVDEVCDYCRATRDGNPIDNGTGETTLPGGAD